MLHSVILTRSVVSVEALPGGLDQQRLSAEAGSLSLVLLGCVIAQPVMILSGPQNIRHVIATSKHDAIIQYPSIQLKIYSVRGIK